MAIELIRRHRKAFDPQEMFDGSDTVQDWYSSGPVWMPLRGNLNTFRRSGLHETEEGRGVLLIKRPDRKRVSVPVHQEPQVEYRVITHREDMTKPLSGPDVPPFPGRCIRIYEKDEPVRNDGSALLSLCPQFFSQTDCSVLFWHSSPVLAWNCPSIPCGLRHHQAARIVGRRADG